MLDSIYKNVQAMLNKDQLGYLKPMDFNTFVNNSQNKVWNKLRSDVKSNTRKSNWMLDGKNLSDYSDQTKQLLEHFTDEETVSRVSDKYQLPSNLEFVEDVYFGEVPVAKLDYADYRLLQRSIYAKPTLSYPICTKVGRVLNVSPNTVTDIDVHFVRRPKTSKWTFVEVNGKPMYDPTALDFEDIDMPYAVLDEIISHTFQQASIQLRELQSAQLDSQDQSKEIQLETRD